MSTPHINHYRKRQVAQASEKSCSICHRPTDTVLMSRDSKDWFYCCSQHLKDRGFATPILDQAAEAERSKQIEIAKVKAEYEEKKKRKAEAEAERNKEKEEKDKNSKSRVGSWIPNPFSSSSKPEEKSKTPEAMVPATEEPKEFALHRTTYQHRVNLKQQAAQQKARDAQWSTITFPSAPSK